MGLVCGFRSDETSGISVCRLVSVGDEIDNMRDMYRQTLLASVVGYRQAWRQLQRETDLVVRAVAEDIDAEAYLYIGTKNHPRTYQLSR
jgi:hypothetical protein